jgi:hypothetical protein
LYALLGGEVSPIVIATTLIFIPPFPAFRNCSLVKSNAENLCVRAIIEGSPRIIPLWAHN